MSQQSNQDPVSHGITADEAGGDALDFGLREAFKRDSKGRPVNTPQPSASPGKILNDRYRLIEEIGSGGMGTVWMAEQTVPVKRRVAIKLIKPGMGSGEVLARFEAERQALAMLDHPNIAKLFDGGSDHNGQPFFVMELVKGVPITRYCDELRLNTRQRLELFIPICQAVQHAHQKGIIHRDLKPSNLLIAQFDDQPVPKVIDFGVAKAVGSVLTEATLHTGFSAIVGTLEYMSPEQALFNNRDIDTRADIYSLGVVLYELLVGTPPFHRDDLSRLAIDQVLKVIREVDPPRPSQKLSTSKRIASLAAQRNSDPGYLKRTLRRDLDWLVMKSLDKDRGRRYSTSAELGQDIQRFLLGDAIEAAPPSLLYRTQKWLRKHRVFAAVSLVTLASLIVGIVGIGIGYLRTNEARLAAQQSAQAANMARDDAIANAELARQSAETSQAFADHLVNGFLKVARPLGWNGGMGVEVTVRDALFESEKELSTRFRDQPAAEITARTAHAETWFELGEYRRAEMNWRRILELYPVIAPSASESNQPPPSRVYVQLGMSLLRQGQRDAAKEYFEKVLAQYSTANVEPDPDTILAHLGLAEIDLNGLRPQLVLDRLLPIFERMESDTSLASIEQRTQIGPLISAAYEALGQLDLAIQLDQQLLALTEKTFGADHWITLVQQNNVAQNLWKAKKYPLSIPIFRKLVDSSTKLLGPDHPTTLQLTVNLAANLTDSGQPAQGESQLELVLPRLIDKLGDHHEKTLEARRLLGIAAMNQKRWSDAQLTFSSVWQDSEQFLGKNHTETLEALSYYGESLQRAGKLKEAIEMRKELLDRRQQRLDGHDPKLLPTMNNLATLYWRAGDLDQSIPLFRQVVELCSRTYGTDDRRTLQATANLAVNLRDNQQLTEAIQILDRIGEAAEQHSGLEWIEGERIVMYLMDGNRSAAEPWLQKQETRVRRLLAEEEARSEPDRWKLANHRAAIAHNLVRQRRFEEAKPLLEQAIDSFEQRQIDSWQLANARSLLAHTMIHDASTESVDSVRRAEILLAAEQHLLAAIELLDKLAAGDRSLQILVKEAQERLKGIQSMRDP